MLVFAAVVALAATVLQDPSARFWNQLRSNPEGTAAVEVEGVLAKPVESWRLQVGPILCEPVVWGEVLYVVTDEGRTRSLHAIRLSDGQTVARARIASRSDFTHLGVWAGAVVVVEPDAVRTYAHRGEVLRFRKKIRGEFGSPPCIVEGRALVSGSSGELACIDIARGKLEATVRGMGYGRPTYHGGTAANVDVRGQPGYQGNYFVLLTSVLSGLDGGDISFGRPLEVFSGLVPGSTTAGAQTGYVIAFPHDEQGEGVWYGRSPRPLESTQGTLLPGAIFGTQALSAIASTPAVANGLLYGFSSEGTFVVQRPDGHYVPVVEKEKLPGGSRTGPVALARGVAFLPNWAVELETGRVLWCVPELDSADLLLPVADGRLVYWTEGGELVSLVGAREGAAEPEAVEAAAWVRPSHPGEGAGVVLVDGRRLAGAVEPLTGGGVRVTPAGGEPSTLTRDELALVETGEVATLVGPEHPVFQAWLAALNAEAVDELVALLRGYLDVRQVEECQRVLVEARRRGLDGERATELDALLAGKTQSRAANARSQLERLRREEAQVRARLSRSFVEASDWCGARGLGATATVLLDEARLLDPFADVETRALERIPPGFPWHESAKAAELWMEWARALLPSGARFVAPGEETWKRVEGTTWEEDTMALSSPNLLVFCKSREASVIGACLENGERAVLALEELFGRAPGPREPFDVRIHATEEDYRTEQNPDGTFAMPWTAGYYSPKEAVSRFFVPRSQQNEEPLGRELHRVFAHELVHQYLSEAWLPHGTSQFGVDQPGYWIVEGVARFVEDQVVEMARRGRRFDDSTVRSLDAMAHVVRQRGFQPLKSFVDLTYRQFLALPKNAAFPVELRHTLAKGRLSPVAVFYEEAGSLVYFLVNEYEDGRERLGSYLESYYTGQGRKEGWKALGFDSAKELETAFQGFLEGLRDS